MDTTLPGTSPAANGRRLTSSRGRRLSLPSRREANSTWPRSRRPPRATRARAAPASGQGAGGYPQGNPQQYAQPQGNPQQYAGQQYPPPQSGQQYGGAQYAQPQQYAAPQSAPSQQASAQLAKDPRADDWVRLKGRANVAILNSALRFFGFPFLSLLIGFARAHDVYDAAKQLGAPSDVLLRARIAMGTAAFFFFLQIAILVVVVIGANM